MLPSVNVETGYGTRFTERRTVWFDRLRYDGPIVAADGWYAIQRVASQTFVAHSVQALDDSPQVGAVVSIHHGHIIAPERQETRGMNRKRKPTP
ncbi:KfrB domain-containing protein [Thiolapillus sp.]|uniref:KfrB domain-containing protein n=1 Tax=Thiolapillus sp. TaxID=2017437 RepID=UPI003AF8829C